MSALLQEGTACLHGHRLDRRFKRLRGNIYKEGKTDMGSDIFLLIGDTMAIIATTVVALVIFVAIFAAIATCEDLLMVIHRVLSWGVFFAGLCISLNYTINGPSERATAKIGETAATFFRITSMPAYILLSAGICFCFLCMRVDYLVWYFKDNEKMQEGAIYEAVTGQVQKEHRLLAALTKYDWFWNVYEYFV